MRDTDFEPKTDAMGRELGLLGVFEDFGRQFAVNN